VLAIGAMSFGEAPPKSSLREGQNNYL